MDTQARTSSAFVIVTTLFFAWGFTTSLIDPLVASVKAIFSLTDVEAQLSASAFFIAYGLMSFPAAAFLSRVRAVRCLLVSLTLMLIGCLVMLGAVELELYALLLCGLFVLASGITGLQVAANPLAAALGPTEKSHFRLTLSQAFNSLGTFIGPYCGALLFLEGVEIKEGVNITAEVRDAALAGIDRAFFWIAVLIALLALFIFVSRRVLRAASPASSTTPLNIAGLLRDALSARWAVLGGGAIFLYVGAEVAIGTQMALFLNGQDILGLPLQDAGKLVSLYWGGAMVGRLIGTLLLTRVLAARLLAVFAAVNAAICVIVISSSGELAGYAALSMGLFNSVMFPLIFSLTLERSTASAEATSGFLCFAIVGGAAIPPLVGLVSQHSSYSFAFIVPALCYALLVGFAVLAALHKYRSIPPAA
jgi:FHS family L-fucose permease-like MFS transporter